MFLVRQLSRVIPSNIILALDSFLKNFFCPKTIDFSSFVMWLVSLGRRKYSIEPVEFLKLGLEVKWITLFYTSLLPVKGRWAGNIAGCTGKENYYHNYNRNLFGKGTIILLTSKFMGPPSAFLVSPLPKAPCISSF